MDEAATNAKKWWLPRFSLVSALLLMTVVGMSIVIARLWREVGPLRAENKRLNEERGTLVIGNPTQLHAIAIPSRFAGEGRQSFRVYIPPGQTYYAFVKINDIPKQGLPKWKELPGHVGVLGSFQKQLFGRLEPGEPIVTIRTECRGKRADIQLIATVGSSNFPLDAHAITSKDEWPTVAPETFTVFGSDGVRSTSVAVDAGEPLVLLRHRVMGVDSEIRTFSYKVTEPDGPLDGVMLWVEPMPK
jgi:hypothetical protein